MDVLIAGGGMITHDQILPSLYHLGRLGRVGRISVAARTAQTLDRLGRSAMFAAAFPGLAFRRWAGEESFREALATLTARSLVVIALPDHLHYGAILAALRGGQHVFSVKPFVLRAAEAEEIEREAFARGLLVAIDYHKRFDTRSLMARRRYREGELGEFRLGSAHLFEKWRYRDSNFQNWCTAENSDCFTYVGCHYVDLVQFITGLEPTTVSVYGVLDSYPNGRKGYLWTDARVLWSNGACLNVQSSLGYPDAAPGANSQGLALYCTGSGRGALIDHSDQFRGVRFSTGDDYSEPNPDYFQYVEWEGEGLAPSGYGYVSVERALAAMERVEEAGDLEARQRSLREIDAAGLVATPANSRPNERVIEAGRRSIRSGGGWVACQ